MTPPLELFLFWSFGFVLGLWLGIITTLIFYWEKLSDKRK